MMQGLQAMKDSAALLVYWDGEASDISWPEPCIVEYVTNGQGEKKIFPSDINGENRHADSDR